MIRGLQSKVQGPTRGLSYIRGYLICKYLGCDVYSIVKRANSMPCLCLFSFKTHLHASCFVIILVSSSVMFALITLLFCSHCGRAAKIAFPLNVMTEKRYKLAVK